MTKDSADYLFSDTITVLAAGGNATVLVPRVGETITIGEVTTGPRLGRALEIYPRAEVEIRLLPVGETQEDGVYEAAVVEDRGMIYGPTAGFVGDPKVPINAILAVPVGDEDVICTVLWR